MEDKHDEEYEIPDNLPIPEEAYILWLKIKERLDLK